MHPNKLGVPIDMSTTPLQRIIGVAQFVTHTFLWPSVEDPIDTLVSENLNARCGGVLRHGIWGHILPC